MLQYLQPEDEVFRDVMQEALNWMIEDLRENALDPEAYRDLAPRAAGFLEPSVAIETLEGLRTCSDGPDLYQLKAPHRLLLTDVLVRYCDLFNEDPCGGYDSEVHAKYGLRHLDGTRLIAAFIGTEYALTECGGVQRDEGGYAANVAHGQVDAVTVRGQRLRDQDLALHRVAHGSDQANIVPATGSPWYRVGAEFYPVVTAMG